MPLLLLVALELDVPVCEPVPLRLAVMDELAETLVVMEVVGVADGVTREAKLRPR